MIRKNVIILGSSSLTAGNIKNGVTIFGVTGNFTGWVDNTAAISTIWPLQAQSGRTEYWYVSEYTNEWIVKYGYHGDVTNGITVAKRLYNAGFRTLYMDTSLYAYDRSGVSDGGIWLSWEWWYINSSGNETRYTKTGHCIYPDDTPTDYYHDGWFIGDGVKQGSTATFRQDPSVRVSTSLSPDGYAWLTWGGVYVWMEDVAALSSGTLRMNSYNFWFSK